jgi:hypothetical protein
MIEIPVAESCRVQGMDEMAALIRASRVLRASPRFVAVEADRPDLMRP